MHLSSFTLLGIAAIVLPLLRAQSTPSNSEVLPVKLTAAEPDFSNQTLTIRGTGFGPAPTVTLGKVKLAVRTGTATSLLAALPAGTTYASLFLPGSYLLKVISGSTATFEVTLSGAGPGTAYFIRESEGDVPLPSSGQYVIVARSILPPGAYAITGRAQARAVSGTTTVSCHAFATDSSGSFAFVGSGDATVQVTGGVVQFSTMGVVGIVKAVTPTTLTLQCANQLRTGDVAIHKAGMVAISVGTASQPPDI